MTAITDNGEKLIFSEEGKVRVVPKRVGYNGAAAFVDWLTFTFHESSVTKSRGFVASPVSDEQLIMVVSQWLARVLGFGITERRSLGMNFYTRSYVIGDNYGFVCHGGQNGTLCVILNGDGCAAAREGWEKRLHDSAQSGTLINARITRCDLAHDDFGGAYSVDWAREAFGEGKFRNHARNPYIEMRGNWVEPDGSGRTLYIGKRQSGKYARIYEKGRQMGDPDSEWLRIEVEFKNEDRVIPWDCLLRPGEYLAGAYPALAEIAGVQCRIRTLKARAEKSLARVESWMKHQCGASLAALMVIYGSADVVMERIADPAALDERLPAAFVIPDVRNSPAGLHEDLPAWMVS